MIASVAIANSTREFDKEFHYAVSQELEAALQVGSRVLVPFGRGDRTREAVVVGFAASTEVSGLKYVKSLMDDKPMLSHEMLQLAAWMRHRYICTYWDAVRCMLPPGVSNRTRTIVRLNGDSYTGDNASWQTISQVLKAEGGMMDLGKLKESLAIPAAGRVIKAMEKAGVLCTQEVNQSAVREKTMRVAYLNCPREEIVEAIESNRLRRIQHIRVLELLLENDWVSVQDILQFASVTPSVLNTLKKNGYINFKEVEVLRDPYENRNIPPTSPFPPTLQQQQVLDCLKASLDGRAFEEALIHGVTGSGKTEVYLQLIQHCFDQGRQAIVLVPEISLTPQMVERFKGRFGDEVAVLHSRLSLGERYDQWRMIKEGGIRVVVGARSAIFAPFDQLGLVIIDEEHENSYKSETTPKYHAREIARMRCQMKQALLVYGSATPSVETFYRAKKGQIRLLEMTERTNGRALPRVEMIDMRSELENGNRSVFSVRLVEEVNRNLQKQEQTLMFLNRRGYASFVLCRKCGLTLTCPNCNISLTYHANGDRLICHYCGYTSRNPAACPRCKSTYIRQFGTGTQKIEEEIHKQFAHAAVMRMDMDTTTGKNSHEELLQEFKDKNVDIMVGTQMIAKGHDFPNVTLVGVLAADSMLNIADFRASERTFQLLTQVAGRAGRGELEGRVLVQTYNTEDFSIDCASRHDYAGFYRQEILVREKLQYPPFMYIGVLLLSGLDDRMTFSMAGKLKKAMEQSFMAHGREAAVLGPTRAPLTRIKRKYRWRIVIKCTDEEAMIQVFTEMADRYAKSPAGKDIEMSMDINPQSML